MSTAPRSLIPPALPPAVLSVMVRFRSSALPMLNNPPPLTRGGVTTDRGVGHDQRTAGLDMDPSSIIRTVSRDRHSLECQCSPTVDSASVHVGMVFANFRVLNRHVNASADKNATAAGGRATIPHGDAGNRNRSRPRDRISITRSMVMASMIVRSAPAPVIVTVLLRMSRSPVRSSAPARYRYPAPRMMVSPPPPAFE